MANLCQFSELSKASYVAFNNSGKLKRYKELIINQLSVSPKTRNELVPLVNACYPSNITAPLIQLENDGLICRCGVVQDKITGRMVTQYCLVQGGSSTEMLSISMHISGTYSSSTDVEFGFSDSKNTSL